jgi:S1-C subfamily serine protease
MADAVETIGKSLVMVNGRPRQPATGIAYEADLLLTADHVLEREDKLTVQTYDGRVLNAQVVGRDASTDLAVLRVSGLSVPVVGLAAQARVGQLALAVARPSPEGVMASLGVVSKVGGPLRAGRSTLLERYIQTDAVPYPGFSGGALVDASGAPFGLFTTGFGRGLAIAIPMALALQVAQTLTRQGYVKRGYLGIISQQVKLPPAQQRSGGQESGLLVVRVEENSPAERGGVLIGDILLAVEEQPIRDADDLIAALSGDRVGRPVTVRIIRGGVLQTLSVIVGQKS